MERKVIVLLAVGFEEMEAVISIDMLRRAGCTVTIVSITQDFTVMGSRKIPIKADICLSDAMPLPDAIILPGGMPGAQNLANSTIVIDLIKNCVANGKIVAAICAAPAYALVAAGVLSGKKATCYPGGEQRFPIDTKYLNQPVVVDGNIITSQGPGTAFAFSLTLIEKLFSIEKADEIRTKALVK